MNAVAIFERLTLYGVVTPCLASRVELEAIACG